MQILDYIYIDDVIEAYIKAEQYFEHFQAGHIEFGIGSNERYSLREVIAICEMVLNRKLNVVFGGKPYRTREVMLPSHIDKKLPNWETAVTLYEGLKKCYREQIKNKV